MTSIIRASAIIDAKDQTGGIFTAIANKIARINRNAEKANRAVGMGVSASAAQAQRTVDAVGTKASKAQTAMAAIAASRAAVPAGAAAAAAYAGQRSYRRFAETDLAVERIGITADASAADIDRMKTSLRDLAVQTAQPFDQVAAGLASIVASGENLSDAMKLMPTVTRTAQASGSEITDIANTSAALKSAFDIDPSRMQAAFDILNVSGKSGKFELKDLSRYMASLAPAAKALGYTGEEGLHKVAAMLQTIRMGTGTSEEAATSMSNIFQKLESEETVSNFKKLGIDLPKAMEKARKEGKPVIEAFVDLAKQATKGDLSKIGKIAKDSEFARGLRALTLYGDKYEEFQKKTRKSLGANDEDLSKVMARPAMSIKKISESFDRLTESFGHALEAAGGLSSKMDAISDVAQKLARFGILSGDDRRSVLRQSADDIGTDMQIDELEREIGNREAEERSKTRPSFFERFMGKKDLEPLDDRLNAEDLRQMRTQLDMLRRRRAAPAAAPNANGAYEPLKITSPEVLEAHQKEQERAQAVMDKITAAVEKHRPKSKQIPLPQPRP